METLVGREAERRLLFNALQSKEAELIAIYGRRRVGKTFLIRSAYKDNIVFEFSGLHEARLDQQLLNFGMAFHKPKQPSHASVPGNWIEAFYRLQKYLTRKLKKQNSVVFFDEFPWINTPRSGFLSAFEHFWNTWASRQNNLVIVICGSAASWMIRNIVNNKGGLHNRITQKIRLMPFNLYEVEEYLKSRKIKLDRYQVLQLYMAMGGIPQYLKNINPGESAAQIIDRFCFTKDGPLKEEFLNLYRSLFINAENYIAVIRVLAKKGKGLTRKEIISSCKLSSGGTATRLLEELTESGFITPYIPFDKRVKDNVYRLTDEYSLFYLKFMDKARATGPGSWLKLMETQSWKSWSGFAFEGICLKHTAQIKQKLGISGVLTEESVWRNKPGKNEEGIQIDLLIDRNDHTINICEIKFSRSEFAIDKILTANLNQKLNVFKERTNTHKTLFITFITTFGLKNSTRYAGLVQNEVTMDALFEL